MEEITNEQTTPSDRDKNLEAEFIRNNLKNISADLSVLDAALTTDQLLKSNLNKLVETLNLKEFSTIDKLNRIQLTNEAWEVYEKLRLNYSLEGDQNHWLTCLIYTTYHKITLLNKVYHLTNKTKPDDVEGQQHLSVVNLLRFTNLNLITFLKKCKKLNEILNIPSELCYRIDQLELNYNVSCVLYSKYKLMFTQMFNCFSALYDYKSNDYVKSNELYEFTWLLFINIRSKFTQLSNDLVNSFHLLICCLNLLYLNLLPSQHDDSELKQYKKFLVLIKSDLTNKTNTSLIDFLCKQFDGQTLEAKTINEHYFKPQLQLLIDKNVFNTRLIAPKCEHSTLICLKKRPKFKRIIQRLNKSYDSFLTVNNSNMKYNAFNCLDLIYSFDIDERLFLSKSTLNEFNTSGVTSDNDDEIDDLDDETDSHSLISYEVDTKTDTLKLPNSLQLITKLNKDELKLNLKKKFNLTNFELIETNISNDFKSYLLNEFNFKLLTTESETNSLHHCRKKRKLDKTNVKNVQIENSLKLVDLLFDLVFSFYLQALDLVLSLEQSREQFKSTKLVENETFHKSIYICCFELVYNFSQISLNQLGDEFEEFNLNSLKLNTYLNLITLSHSNDQFKFPKTLELAQVNEYDFFRVIESFIKSTTITSQSVESNFNLLDREMIRYLNNLEEQILESFVWTSHSSIWSKLKELKLNENYLSSFQSNSNLNLHLLVPFPLYDDVTNLNQIVQTPLAQQSAILNAAVSNSNSNNSDIVINLTPNPMTPSSNSNIFTSPAKHPTITRVVCSSSDSTKSLTNKPIQILSLNSSNKKQVRLNNLTNSMMFFFRKFYNLANQRVRDLVEKLDLVNLSLEFYNTSNKTTSTETNTPPYQNQHLANEFQQAILKKIWNIFEYSISIGTANKQNLITDRHLDHLLLCSIYVTCRSYSFKIQFNDIIKVYRSVWPSKYNIYKDIIIDSNKYSDLISFYNELFIKTIKPYLIELNGSTSISLTPNLLLTENSASNLSKKLISPSMTYLSPVVPKLQNTAMAHLVQFSPRRLSDNIFVSPIKQNIISVQQHRNKLLFSLKDTNPNKSVQQINEMIRKNEIKIKPPQTPTINANITSNATNKRIFSDISTASLNSNQQQILPTTSSLQTNSLKSIKLEDETDSSLSKQQQQPTMRITSINSNKGFLSTVVGSKLGFMSNTNNLVTMVVNGQTNVSTSSSSFTNTSTVNSSLVGANFVRKLQNIQTERIN